MFRAVRRAKLARVLRFYADKAQRHHLPAARHAEFAAEIDRMVERGGDYVLSGDSAGDRGWVFCPEYAGRQPLEISPRDWSTKVFLFGPCLLPDSNVSQETFTSTSPPPSAGARARGNPRQCTVRRCSTHRWCGYWIPCDFRSSR